MLNIWNPSSTDQAYEAKVTNDSGTVTFDMTFTVPALHIGSNTIPGPSDFHLTVAGPGLFNLVFPGGKELTDKDFCRDPFGL